MTRIQRFENGSKTAQIFLPSGCSCLKCGLESAINYFRLCDQNGELVMDDEGRRAVVAASKVRIVRSCSIRDFEDPAT